MDTQHISLCLPPVSRSSKLCQPGIGRGISAVISLWVIVSSPGEAQPSSSIKILERGVYRAETISRKPTPGTTGIINTVQNPQLISSTTTVIGRVGVRFGLRYSLMGAERSSEKVLKLVVVFPLSGLRNPETGQIHYHNDHELTVRAGVALYWEYHFENEWEIADGAWTFEFWDRNKKIGQQRFCVHRENPNSMPLGHAEECRRDLLGFRPGGPVLERTRPLAYASALSPVVLFLPNPGPLDIGDRLGCAHKPVFQECKDS